MSAIYQTLCRTHKIFTFVVVFCALSLSVSSAWATPSDVLDKVEKFQIVVTNVGTTEVLYEEGPLVASTYGESGFLPASGYGYPLTPDFASPAVQTAISAKMVIKLSEWNAQLEANSSDYLDNFHHSTETYTIQGSEYVIVTVVGGYTLPPDPKAPDTKPKLNEIGAEWDAEAGQPFSEIVLSVRDDESDAFEIKGGPKGSSFVATEDVNQLPSLRFEWTPTLAQANKVITVKFKAKETAHKRLTSNTVTAKIRVWPAGGQTDAASVSKFSVSTVKWSADTLTLAGKVVLNKIMSAQQRADFFAKTLDLTLTAGTTGTGPAVGSSPLPLTLSDKGIWSVTMPLPEAEVPCKITLQYEGRPAARKVARAPKGCLK